MRTFVLRISTMDVNSGELGRIVYTLTGRHSDHFDLDPHTGKFNPFLIGLWFFCQYVARLQRGITTIRGSL